MKAGRGSPITDVNKDVGSAVTLSIPPQPAALPASHMPCTQAGGPLLLPFLEARTTELLQLPACQSCLTSYFCRIGLGAEDTVLRAAVVNRN